jgi:pyridoxal/pyridoxine/pyridoxamine kinase
VIRFVLFVLAAVFLVWCGTTVKLGDHTFYGHVKRIWQSEETKDLRDGIKQKARTEVHDATKETQEAAGDAAQGAVDETSGEATEATEAKEAKEAQPRE